MRDPTWPRAPMLRAVLLDAGNTLVFLDHDVVAKLARDHDVPLTAEDCRRAEPIAKRRYERWVATGGSHESGWALHMTELMRAAGAPETTLPELVLALRAAHDDFNLWRRVPADLPAALERLRAAGLKVGVVSNSEGQLDALLERVGLAPLLDVVVDSAIEGVRKPDPALFQLALERLGCQPSHAVYAGDIPEVDVAGARAAGIAGVLVDTANHYPDYAEAPRVRSVAELVERLL